MRICVSLNNFGSSENKYGFLGTEKHASLSVLYSLILWCALVALGLEQCTAQSDTVVCISGIRTGGVYCSV